MPQEILFLPSEDLPELADIDEHIEAVRDGYRQQATTARTEAPTGLLHPTREGLLWFCGAVLPETGVMGVFNWIGDYEDGDTWFLTYLANSETGDPLAIVDSSSVNPHKTGATGAVAVDALANKDASVVAVIGTGVQAKAQLIGTTHVRDVSEVRVYSPTAPHRQQFVQEMNDRLLAGVAETTTANEAVRGADVVITATTATDPVFDGAALDDGTHVTAIGQTLPDRRELDAETIARATYVPDLCARAERASGELLGAIRAGAIDRSHVHAELGEVVAGAASGRESETDVTVFDSGGTGIETIASTHLVYERAKRAEYGVTLPMTPGSEAVFDL